MVEFWPDPARKEPLKKGHTAQANIFQLMEVLRTEMTLLGSAPVTFWMKFIVNGPFWASRGAVALHVGVITFLKGIWWPPFPH